MKNGPGLKHEPKVHNVLLTNKNLNYYGINQMG